MQIKDQEEYLKKREIILTDKVWRVLLLISLPMALSNFIQVFYSSIDTFFAARLGVEVIAGVSFSLYLVNFIRSMGMGICIAGTTLIARDIGAGDSQKAKSTMGQLFLLLTVISLILLLAILPFSRRILLFIGGTEDIISYSETYFRLNILSLFFLFISQAYLSIKKAMGGVRLILISNIISLLVKWFSCYIFVEIFDLGIHGLVFSTIIARTIICFMAFYDLVLKKSQLQIDLSDLKLVRLTLISILLMGIPLGLEKSTISVGNILLNRISITFGYEFIAARGIVNKMINLGQSLLTGFAVGVAPIISQNIGAGNYHRVREIIFKASSIAITMSVSMYFILRKSGESLARLFIGEHSDIVFDFIMEGFYIFGFAMIGWSLYQVGMSVFKGFGHTKNNMSISFIRLFILRVPLVYTLILYTTLAQKGLWIGMLISNALGLIILWGFIYMKYYKDDAMKVYFQKEKIYAKN